MQFKSIASLLLAASFALVATNSFAVPQGKRETEEQKQARKLRMYKKLGGRAINLATMKGRFVFFNAQSKVDGKALSETANSMREYFMSDVRFENNAEASMATIGGIMKSAGAQGGVAIVSDKSLPALITNPEGPWAIINVDALAGNDKLTVRRVKLEMWRALGYLCVPCFEQCMLQPVPSLDALDALPNAMSPEALYRTQQTMEKLGIKPWTNVSYRRACEEGWANSPTDDVQKAIWDKVHAIPSQPMKIKYDPNKAKDAK